MGIGSLIGAGISGAASIFGASNSASASKQAAQAQMYAANQAASTQRDILAQNRGMFDTAQNNLAPFLSAGGIAAGQLNDPQWTTPIAPPTAPAPFTLSQADMEATPGYQFTRDQGLKAVQNSAAARGLGVSGAALKGAATFATGLADSTYNSRWNQGFQAQQAGFQNAQQNWQDLFNNQQGGYNRLYQAAGLGATAAGTGMSGAGAFGNMAATVGGNIGNNLIQGGTAQASGILGAANATNTGLTGFANGAQNALAMYMLGNQKNGTQPFWNGLYG